MKVSSCFDMFVLSEDTSTIFIFIGNLLPPNQNKYIIFETQIFVLIHRFSEFLSIESIFVEMLEFEFSFGKMFDEAKEFFLKKEFIFILLII